MHNLVWLLVVVVVLVLTVVVVVQLQRKMAAYREENRKLKDALEYASAYAMEEACLDRLLQVLHEPVFRLDDQGWIITANRCARALFALPESRASLSLRQGYRNPSWHKKFEQALVSDERSLLLPLMHLSGSVLAPRLLRLRPGLLLLFCVDVSEQERLEKQRSTFLSNLIHDLKTPLTSLLGYAHSLKDFGSDEDFRAEAAAVIADEARHVNRLLDALLTLDQIAFVQRPERVACELVGVVRQVCALLKPQCVERDVRLQVSCALEKLWVAMAEDELDRVLTNLLINAINYSPKGGVVSIDVAKSDCGGRVTIADEGAGIPEKDLPHVTERFYRVDRARSRASGGHGLGLAIVKELLDLHAGRLILENRSTGGLQVVCELPLANDASH